MDQIQEERPKLKWENDNEIDAFYKIEKKLESSQKKSVRLSLTVFSWFQMMLYLRHCLVAVGALVLVQQMNWFL